MFAEDKCPVLRKEILFLVKLLKQNFILGSQGSTLPLNPMAEAHSQHLFLDLRDICPT